MKFDYILGNPPYQGDTVGDQKRFAAPIYNSYMDATYELSDHVMLITPARFLYNAGATPKAWNEKMLADPHLKVIWHEVDSSKVFPDVDIAGGVAVTYHDATKDYGAIGTYTAFDELNSVLHKVLTSEDVQSLMPIVYSQNKFNLVALYADYPELRKVIGSQGTDKRFRNNIFEKVTLFSPEKVNDDDITVLGFDGNRRLLRYFPIKYVDLDHQNLTKWKVMVPTAGGSGAIGDVIPTLLIGRPEIGEPYEGHTQSFRSIGAFETRDEAENCLKYVKSKFARTMLGILKITQDNPPEKWKYVPLQDFTPASDIDWSASIPEIDQQLYRKYGLDGREIDFIETHVKEMN